MNGLVRAATTTLKSPNFTSKHEGNLMLNRVYVPDAPDQVIASYW